MWTRFRVFMLGVHNVSDLLGLVIGLHGVSGLTREVHNVSDLLGLMMGLHGVSGLTRGVHNVSDLLGLSGLTRGLHGVSGLTGGLFFCITSSLMLLRCTSKCKSLTLCVRFSRIL